MSDSNPSRVSSYKDNVNFNTVSAIVFVAISIALFVAIPSQIDEPLIRIGSQNKLSPELFPRMVSIGFFGLGI